LDILHVAAAKLCGAKQFLSFDERLNRLAKAEAMVILGAAGEL
jgi:predicted nucleic acid-binding protein